MMMPAGTAEVGIIAEFCMLWAASLNARLVQLDIQQHQHCSEAANKQCMDIAVVNSLAADTASSVPAQLQLLATVPPYTAGRVQPSACSHAWSCCCLPQMKMPMPQLGSLQGMYQAARTSVGMISRTAVYPNMEDMARIVSSPCSMQHRDVM